MPQLIVPLVVTVAAAGVGAAITGAVAKKEAGRQRASQEAIARETLATEESIAQTQSAQYEAESKRAAELSEKQMMLESQRLQIETLANVMGTQKALAPPQQQSMYVPAGAIREQKPQGFLGTINNFIDSFFR